MTFSELSNFTKQVLRLLDDESYAELQIALFQRPDLGKVLKGSGGLRKVRWAAKGHGKSGDVRVIYYWYVANELITFCRIYPKNEKENLTTDEIKTINDELEN